MSRQIAIHPITRIEGHASVELEIDDANNVASAVFKVMDFRGFETFLRGMQVEMMPTITARICGTCPQTHHVVSARTVDKVFGAVIPRTAELLRQALNLGGMIHSHAVHFFALAGPDLLLGIASDPAARNIVGLVKKHPELAKKALRLRTVGQRIVELIGGRGTHPVSFVAGGVAVPLARDKAEKVRDLAAEGLAIGRELYTVAKGLLLSNKALLQSLPLETHYLGTVKGGALDFYDGDLRLRSPDGKHMDFSEDDWTSYLFEEAVDHTYGKYVYCNKGEEGVPYRVGPLARLNCADGIATPMANSELEEFRKLGGFPCHQTVMYHFARMIELLYSLEKLNELVKDDEMVADDVLAKLSSPQDATAHVEAPRGALIHDYKVDRNGIVTQANLIVATQQNIAAINATVGMSAQQYLEQPDNVLLNAIEFGIRCYDPCLSCATHRIGQMKLDVVVKQNGQVIRRTRR